MEQTGSDTARQHICQQPLNFYFGAFGVVNYTGNYFWDLALFLFEKKAKKKLYIVFALLHFSARTHDITPAIT